MFFETLPRDPKNWTQVFNSTNTWWEIGVKQVNFYRISVGIYSIQSYSEMAWSFLEQSFHKTTVDDCFYLFRGSYSELIVYGN